MPEFPCPGPITVDVRIAAGSVDLYAEPRETAVVEVAPANDSDHAREAAARTHVELSGDTLVISAPEGSGWLIRRSPRLLVTARVPAGSSGRIRVASANATCHGQWSQVKVNTASGDSYVEQLTGDLSVNTASGDVRAGQIGGRLTVKTASGDVSARQVTGPVDVKSASGNLQLDQVDSDLTATTASGDATVGAACQGSLRANTVSGDVSVGVVSGTGVWLDLNTLSGKTRSDLSVSEGGGGASGNPDLTLQVKTVSGSIDVRRVTLPTPA